jgi:hypothetical protein
MHSHFVRRIVTLSHNVRALDDPIEPVERLPGVGG